MLHPLLTRRGGESPTPVWTKEKHKVFVAQLRPPAPFGVGEEKYEEDEDEDEDDEQASTPALEMSGASRSKVNSETLLTALRALREDMVARGVKYEPAYWTAAELDDCTGMFRKMYVINVGHPDDAERPRIEPKILTAYVGCSRKATKLRVHDKNDLYAEHKDQKTRKGLSRWLLFVIIFFPENWTASTRDIKYYWRCSHGINGKLKRFFEIVDMFNLRYYVNPDAQEYVDKIERMATRVAPFGDANPLFK
jgi:hypothetical protein